MNISSLRFDSTPHASTYDGMMQGPVQLFREATPHVVSTRLQRFLVEARKHGIPTWQDLIDRSGRLMSTAGRGWQQRPMAGWCVRRPFGRVPETLRRDWCSEACADKCMSSAGCGQGVAQDGLALMQGMGMLAGG